MTAKADAPCTLVVAGDVVVDHHLYEGERPRPTTQGRHGVHVVRDEGGAAILQRLIRELLPKSAWNVQLGVKPPPADRPSGSDHAYAVLRPHSQRAADPDKPDEAAKADKVWRIAERMGYGESDKASEPLPCKPADGVLPANVLVLDDGGFEFRNEGQKECWHLPAGLPPPLWILLKMSGPVARGDLWSELIHHHAGRLVCVVSSDDLRQEKLSLGRGLSWERTVEEVCFALRRNTEFHTLTQCAHLVVTFSADGALWLDRTKDEPVATLFFDAGGADGEFIHVLPGDMIGFQTAFTASLARTLAQHAAAHDPLGPVAGLTLDDPIMQGLRAMRNLMLFGHGPVAGDKDKDIKEAGSDNDSHSRQRPTGYPIERLRDVLLKSGGRLEPHEVFGKAIIPQTMFGEPQPAGAARWMIIEMLQLPLEMQKHPLSSTGRPSLFGVACDLLISGTDVALKHRPHARFGGLTTVDRQEIEALRNIRRLMTDYKEDRYNNDPTAIRPLSLGVFGPPGAGKSFGVKQIANGVFGKEAWLEFNLSQFTPPADLIGALHQVRDRVLRGKTPVVFWDEFDSRQFEWLQYLLAPMQDGRFQDGQINHPVGKCVFIFAGGTSESYADFEHRGGPGDSAKDAFKLRKGPDFRSRLDTYYDVLGPNQRQFPAAASYPRSRQPDPSDQGYVLRRALLIHSVLKTEGKALIDLDEGLANALLRVPRYKNGARSLEKLVMPLRREERGHGMPAQPQRPGRNEPLRRSWLPTYSQLAMHVDRPDRFADLLAEQPQSDWLLAAPPAIGRPEHEPVTRRLDPLAAAIHEVWRNSPGKKSARFDMPFESLSEVDKEDNRVAARRIPWILGLAGMAVAKRGAEPSPGTASWRSPALRASEQRNVEATPGKPTKDQVAQQLELHIERLAEAEHDGWMDYRRKNGWRYGKVRNDLDRIHPLLIPYKDLPNDEQEKDRRTVRQFPEYVDKAGHDIVWLGAGET